MNPMKLKTPLILLEPSEIHLVEPLKLDNNPLFRREFLRKGGTTAIMLAIAPSVLFTRDAEANPLAFLAWVGKAAFAGAIGWFIDRTLDIVLPHFGDSLKGGNQLARELNVEERDPKPTAEYEFHNSHASPYVSLNPNYSFKPKYSDRYDYFVELDQYLRSDTDDPLPEFKDLSTPELKRIAREEDYYNTILFPCGPRERPVSNDYAGYSATCHNEYNINPNLMELEYVRPFNDGTHSYASYGVKSKRTGQKDLLISV